MLTDIFHSEQLASVARRKTKDYEFKSVRNSLVDEEIAKGWSVQRRGKTNSRLSKPKSHDRLLEDRVWALLFRMGFKFLSGQSGAHLLVDEREPGGPHNQIDVVAIDDEVAFAIECKSTETPRKFADFSKDLAKHVGLRDRFTKAVRAEFPTATKRPSIFAIWHSQMIVTDNDVARADAEHVSLLDGRDLEYYELLVGQIGTAARYQFLADLLEGRMVPGLEVTVPAIRSKMSGDEAFTFSISPEYLLKIAFVSHRGRGKASDIDAYQRLLKKSRLKSIREYISAGGMFPTNIVLNIAEKRWIRFDRGKQEPNDSSSTFGWLTIRPAYRVAWIIDGQ